jgi:cyclohexanecarboxylate-CoA ligase
MLPLDIRPPEGAVRKYRDAGVWRHTGSIADLRRWREETPEALAIKAYGASGPPVQIRYGQYAQHVERFAGALYELGVRRGDVVAIQLPNWWQGLALFHAVARLGAVRAPIMTTIGPREVERMLRRVDATVVITVDRWAAFDHARALREMAPRLPRLKHRVVFGQPGEGDHDFTALFERTPWEQRHPVALDDATEDPDAIALVLFTSGTTGEPKAALHTHNTAVATAIGISDVIGYQASDAVFTPHALMHAAAQIMANSALHTGACTVLLDSWSGLRGLEVMADSAVTFVMAAPVLLNEMIAAKADFENPAGLPNLRTILAGTTTVPVPLVAAVAKEFGLALRSSWAMTEIGVGTLTRSDDSPDWAAHSDGSPLPSVELDLRTDGDDVSRQRPGRLYVRSGGTCVATVGRDTGGVVIIAERDDGWYETGDLAIPDGSGGIRLMGRVADRIGGALMIPVNDVESELLACPGVVDVALVGYPDGHGGELACAIVVPADATAITLDELRSHLTGVGMTEWYLPSRLECVEALPRNAIGKIRKELLRRWLQGQANLTDDV